MGGEIERPGGDPAGKVSRAPGLDSEAQRWLDALEECDLARDTAWMREHRIRNFHLRYSTLAELHSGIYRQWTLVVRTDKNESAAFPVEVICEPNEGPTIYDNETSCRAIFDYLTGDLNLQRVDEKARAFLNVLRVRNGLGFDVEHATH